MSQVKNEFLRYEEAVEIENLVGSRDEDDCDCAELHHAQRSALRPACKGSRDGRLSGAAGSGIPSERSMESWSALTPFSPDRIRDIPADPECKRCAEQGDRDLVMALMYRMPLRAAPPSHSFGSSSVVRDSRSSSPVTSFLRTFACCRSVTISARTVSPLRESPRGDRFPSPESRETTPRSRAPENFHHGAATSQHVVPTG